MTTPDHRTRAAGVRTTDPTASAPPTAPRPGIGATRAHDDPLRDRVRWGPVWAGTIVVLTTFIVLQLLFFALGWLDLGFDAGGSAQAAGVVSGVLGLVAFFIGGLTAAASTMWRGASTGILQGVMVWALAVVIILGLTLLSGTAVLGPLADVLAQSPAMAPQQVNVDPAQVVGTVRQSAGWAALGLGLGAGAAALGGMSGAALWSSRRGEGART
jgi:hypothetical protein